MMNNSTEKSARKKIRITAVDIAVIILVIACIAGTFIHYRVFEVRNAVKTSDKCNVSVLMTGIENDVSERIEVGDRVYYKDGGKLLGTVAEVDSGDSEVYHEGKNGEMLRTTDPSKKDVTLILRVDGEITENGFLANGTEYVAAGMEISIYTSKLSGTGLVFDVKKQSE